MTSPHIPVSEGGVDEGHGAQTATSAERQELESATGYSDHVYEKGTETDNSGDPDYGPKVLRKGYT